jgi:cell division protein FtsB
MITHAQRVRNLCDSRLVLGRLRPFLPTAALAFLIVYFGFHALTGDRGILTTGERDATLAAKTEELIRVRRTWSPAPVCCATNRFPRTFWKSVRDPC